MRKWKVKFTLGQAVVILDIEAPTWDSAVEAALVLSRRLGMGFNYDLDEVQ